MGHISDFYITGRKTIQPPILSTPRDWLFERNYVFLSFPPLLTGSGRGLSSSYKFYTGDIIELQNVLIPSMLTRSRWHFGLGRDFAFFAYIYIGHKSFKWQNKSILKVEHWQLWKVNKSMGHLERKSCQSERAGGGDGPGSIKSSNVQCHHLNTCPWNEVQNPPI